MEAQELPVENNQNLSENEKITQNQENAEKQNTEVVNPSSDTNDNKDSNGVYERDVYSKPEFWNERFKTTKGNFDWYTEWDNLKKYCQNIGLAKDAKILQVGCGNSTMSGKMYEDGWTNITNIDISDAVIDKMKEDHDKKGMTDMKWLTMDATKMIFEDNSYDLVIDKGTIDALFCGDDVSIVWGIISEMKRVCKQEGYIMLVMHSGPQGRRFLFEQCVPVNDYEVNWAKESLSDKANLINIMRSNLKDKPLSAMVHDKDMLMKTIAEYKIAMFIKSKVQQRPVKLQRLQYQNAIINYRREDFSEQLAKERNLIDAEMAEQKNQVMEKIKKEKKDTETEDLKECIDKKEETNNNCTLPSRTVTKMSDKGYAPVRQNHCYVFMVRKGAPRPIEGVQEIKDVIEQKEVVEEKEKDGDKSSEKIQD